jgi:small subunit ribosomal protein S21
MARLVVLPAGGDEPSPRRCSFWEFLRTTWIMIKVKLRGNETAEQMLRRFKKMCEKEGLTKDIKRIAYYEKPSEKRRRRRKPQSRPIH